MSSPEPDEEVATEWERFLLEEQRSRRRESILGACLLGLIIFVFITVLALKAGASPALECEGIRDPDRRHYCRAITGDLPTECEFIRSRDLRAECRAVLRSHKK